MTNLECAELALSLEQQPTETVSDYILAGIFAKCIQTGFHPLEVLELLGEALSEIEWEPLRSGLSFVALQSQFK